ncbi:MAG: guanylate kinase [Candidatus Latescibacteria bacterium]|nr:guanylate kinase [Candidatus Latescibacterota bacterium]
MSKKLNLKAYYKPKVFVLASPSAAGKTTLCYAAARKDKNIWYSVSATTRAKRPHEKNGREYYFVSDAKFDQWFKTGELLESTTIYDARYGTPKQPILKKIEQGKDIILDLDIAGVKSMKRFYPHTVGIYVIPPSLNELWARLKNRSRSSSDKIKERFSKASAEMTLVFNNIKSKRPFINYVIVNNDLNKAIADLMAIIRAERLRVSK